LDDQVDGITTENYEWILAFANSKRSQLKNLRSLSIMEQEPFGTNDGEVEEWEREPPDDLRKVFDDAGTGLKILRRSIRRRRDDFYSFQ
jgi:hypothetical protein